VKHARATCACDHGMACGHVLQNYWCTRVCAAQAPGCPCKHECKHQHCASSLDCPFCWCFLYVPLCQQHTRFVAHTAHGLWRTLLRMTLLSPLTSCRATSSASGAMELRPLGHNSTCSRQVGMERGWVARWIVGCVDRGTLCLQCIAIAHEPDLRNWGTILAHHVHEP